MREKTQGTCVHGEMPNGMKHIPYSMWVLSRNPETEDFTRYFTVSNDGRVAGDNAHTILGYKSFYRTITCVPVSENEFNGI